MLNTILGGVNINSQFKRGIVELCVLSEINRKEMYGFEIIDSISNEIDVNENTIYPILRRLTKEGYFETYTKETTNGAPRKYYYITDKGNIQYNDLLENWQEFLLGVNNILKRGNV